MAAGELSDAGRAKSPLLSSAGLRAAFGRVWRLMRGGESSPARIASSVALGLFIGCQPVYGLHLPLCVGACLLLRLDSVVAYLAANISNPVIAPFLISAEVEIGSWLLTGNFVSFDVERARQVGVGGFIAQAAVGGTAVGGLLALLGGALVYVLSKARNERRKDALEGAIARTLQRYRSASIGDRSYVAGKLRHDPVLPRIVELGIPLGDTVDAGAGRGQLGLCLRELGLVESLVGFDLDPRKVELAQQAAAGDASFAVADLSAVDLPAADTVLLVDVLHYLPLVEQDALLERAAKSLRPGGRLLVRDADKKPGAKSLLTRALEQLALATRVNRSRAPLSFRPMSEVVRHLEKLGLHCVAKSAAQGTPLSNVLVIATRMLPQPA